MRGVLLSLSKLDVNAESFLRIITYFDQLVRNRASLDALVRATAALAECGAGLRDDCNGVVVRFTETGEAPGPGHRVALAETPILLDQQTDGSGWLERDGDTGPFDRMLTERMAFAAAVLWQHDLGRELGVAPELALFDLALSASTGEVDRARALSRLGFSEALPVQVLAVSTEDPDDLGAATRRVCNYLTESVQGRVRGAVVGLKGAIIAQPALLTDQLVTSADHDLRHPGTKVGMGTTALPPSAHISWLNALSALRLSETWLASTTITECLELGVLTLLAELPPAAISSSLDIQALTKLGATPRGVRDIEALEALFKTGSLRQAAADMYLHHSSLAARLRHVEDSLGLSLNDPIGRLRAQISVALWRLLVLDSSGK
ncbi:MAG: helix-turn-helix domain-containing protein [Acidimicrobiales bacterium]